MDRARLGPHGFAPATRPYLLIAFFRSCFRGGARESRPVNGASYHRPFGPSSISASGTIGRTNDLILDAISVTHPTPPSASLRRGVRIVAMNDRRLFAAVHLGLSRPRLSNSISGGRVTVRLRTRMARHKDALRAQVGTPPARASSSHRRCGGVAGVAPAPRPTAGIMASAVPGPKSKIVNPSAPNWRAQWIWPTPRSPERAIREAVAPMPG